MADTTEHGADPEHEGGTRRDFLYLTTAAVGVVGLGVAVWPFINSMNPAADTLALASIDVRPDQGSGRPARSIIVMWQGKPVFVRYRTPAELAERVIADDHAPDPEGAPDRRRAHQAGGMPKYHGRHRHLAPIWAACRHSAQKSTDPRGDYGGYFCPCHGSHYDTPPAASERGPRP